MSTPRLDNSSQFAATSASYQNHFNYNLGTICGSLIESIKATLSAPFVKDQSKSILKARMSTVGVIRVDDAVTDCDVQQGSPTEDLTHHAQLHVMGRAAMRLQH